MQSASSDRRRLGFPRKLSLLALGLGLLLAVLGALAGARAPTGRSEPAIEHAAYRLADGTIGPREQRKLRTSRWQGGSFTTSTGEAVRVLVSDSYPDATALGQRWAEFFAAQLHGQELGLVTAHVVPRIEIADYCGPHALGCYGGGRLVFMDETVSGVTAEEVARHEYGHHVAANRPNPPWLSVDTGPKHWSSAANVCLRTRQGTAFPGNEDRNYTLNPGEAFAEAYRALAELRAGATSFSWSLVDNSFHPDTVALEAVERDVVAPWTTPQTSNVRARFNGKKVWKLSLPTSLDGNLSVTLKFARGGLHDLAVLANGNVLGKGLWSGAAEKRVTTTVCGQRTIIVRVTPRGPGRTFSVQVTRD